MPEPDERDFDEEFMQSIVAWRERHRLREDEAVLLLVELFRIHQRHWDEIRQRELPSFEQYRADIAKLANQSAQGGIKRLLSERELIVEICLDQGNRRVFPLCPAQHLSRKVQAYWFASSVQNQA